MELRGSPFISGVDDPLEALDKPELVLGIVGPVGTDRDLIFNMIEKDLRQYGYETHRIPVSRILHQLENLELLASVEPDEFQRIRAHMDAGTALRKASRRGDALALLSVAEIRAVREAENRDKAIAPYEGATLSDSFLSGHVFVIDSLKHPQEIESLRAIYGRAFVVFSVSTPRSARVQALAARIAQSRFTPQNVEMCKPEAEQLVQIDEKEIGTKLGQNVRTAFPIADVFIDASHPHMAEEAVARFFELLFNNPFRTPTRDEYGMFYAEASAWRSGDLARQVGAAITSPDGELIATGCNEVPKPAGGYYWDQDCSDARDLVLGKDSGTEQKQLMVAEIMKRIRESEFVPEDDKVKVDEIIRNTIAGDIPPLLEDVRALNVIEYGRAVHAEMAAISDAAKRGISVQGAVMFVNTFPCHICARHVLAAGISRLVYIEPYPKSLTEQLYSDQIDTSNSHAHGKIPFEPFCGVAPRLYPFLFQTSADRKDKSGKKSRWEKASAKPKLKRYVLSYIAIEQQVVAKLIPQVMLAAKEIRLRVLDDGNVEITLESEHEDKVKPAASS